MKVDPFKELVRESDRRVVANGGRSLFGTPYPGTLSTVPAERVYSSRWDDRLSEPMTPEKVKELSAAKHAPRFHRTSPKPGRIQSNSQVSRWYRSDDDRGNGRWVRIDLDAWG